ncbi:alpha-L-fucosidase [Pelagicoccus mobilis]|uniref:alpha-L-fucosidase n=1 Tax=Pelagicoccus mobilis TaxID=415221 RepID=A0A934RT64_9BACT|nr:alpha-L-fucosidase [Pelagicoccus mobilis]MBK1875921.1 alpha-L-fucosidase [Pelagicoccus mobilis]
MKKAILAVGLSAFAFSSALGEDEPAEYKLDWSEMEAYENEPEWFQDSKLGIYFHWGVYSVPAFGTEWYPRYMHLSDSWVYKHHVKTYGHPSEFGYHDFVPMFTAENFDPVEWAELFKKAGAKFAGPVAEHHDGFAMWDTETSPWNVVDMGPKRDITGEIADAIRDLDMKFIATFHHARQLQRPNHPESYEKEYPHHRFFYHSHFPPVEGMPTLSDDKDLQMLYGQMDELTWLEEIWLPKLKEVIDNYDPDIIWFDAWLDKIPEIYRREYLSYYYKEGAKKGQEVVTTFKQDDLPEGTAVFNIEKGGKTEISENVWQSDDTISLGSWSYTETLKIKPASMVVHGLIDIVSKNGVLLLNVSPMADGTIPQNQKDVLLRMGEWLELNGEGIYATRPWKVHGEGPTGWEKGNHGGMKTTNVYTSKDKRYTRSKDGKYVYAFVLAQPEDGEVIDLESFAKGAVGEGVKVKSVELVGSKEKVQWSQDGKGVHIESSDSFNSDIALMYKMRVKG